MKIKPFELGAIWNRKTIKSIIIPGCYVYLTSAMYFKSIKINNEYETKEIYMHAKGIKLSGLIYTNYMFGSSSQHNFFCGHKSVTGLFFVKDVHIYEKYLTITVTPIALGAGNWIYSQNTPYELRSSNL